MNLQNVYRGNNKKELVEGEIACWRCGFFDVHEVSKNETVEYVFRSYKCRNCGYTFVSRRYKNKEVGKNERNRY